MFRRAPLRPAGHGPDGRPPTFAGAARLWSRAGRRQRSQLRVRPSEGRCGLGDGGDGPGAQTALDLLAARGARGRAIEADMATARAGHPGDRRRHGRRPSPGYKTAWPRCRDLGLPWDEALLGLAAAATRAWTIPRWPGWARGGAEPRSSGCARVRSSRSSMASPRMSGRGAGQRQPDAGGPGDGAGLRRRRVPRRAPDAARSRRPRRRMDGSAVGSASSVRTRGHPGEHQDRPRADGVRARRDP